jgi:hypothetical protein
MLFFKDTIRESATNLPRPMKILIYMPLYMMRDGSLYITDQLLNRRPFNHIVQPLSLPQRRVLSEKYLKSVSLLG